MIFKCLNGYGGERMISRRQHVNYRKVKLWCPRSCTGTQAHTLLTYSLRLPLHLDDGRVVVTPRGAESLKGFLSAHYSEALLPFVHAVSASQNTLPSLVHVGRVRVPGSCPH